MSTDIRISPSIKNLHFIVSFTEVEEVLQLVEDPIRVNSVILSTGISSYEISINGGAFSTPTLPLDLSANDEVVWKIVFASGQNLGSLSVKAEKI